METTVDRYYFHLPNPYSTSTSRLFSSLTTFTLVLSSIIITGIIVYYLYLQCRQNTVYLIDFVCYRPPDHLRAPVSTFAEHYERVDLFERDGLDFQVKMLERSGIGDEACVPLGVHELPPFSSLATCHEETHTVLFTLVGDLLLRHKINPQSIDILVSNCSLFCPTPSISTMIVNKFGLRSDVKCVSLGGMGCSAGLLSVSLTKDLLKVHNNSLALVVTMEAVSTKGYRGKTKSMLITNTLFRMGGAAILLSNRIPDKRTAKYKLQHVVRTHMGSNDQAYNCVFQQHDEYGLIGVSISRALLNVAGNALRTNITMLGPLVLPYSEQLMYACSLIWKKIMDIIIPTRNKSVYVPNFKRAFEHFCVHAGGRAVIDAVEDSLKLNTKDLEASRMTLYRFGNTSSSSVWYELAYLEAKGRVKKGDRIWQIGFGSGFKCNSAVWKCTSDLNPKAENVWSDRIGSYPVKINYGV